MFLQRHRKSAALLAAAGLVVLGPALSGCSSSRHAGVRPRVTSPSPPPVSAPPSTTAERIAAVTLTVTRAARQIGVQVLYPEGRSGRPFALIVFSPGYDIDPAVYDPLVTGWASLGFVVAVADYPNTAEGAPGGVNEADIVQHPADLESIIGQLLVMSNRSGNVLSGMVDGARIAVAGHSDGAVVADAMVSDSCCRDPRIRAAAVMSGSELTSFGGTYGPARVPLLVVQGDSDTINPPACSVQVYDTTGLPRFYLNLKGAGHLPPYTADPSGARYQPAVDRVTGLFWAAFLDQKPSAATALQNGVDVGPSASWATGGPLTRVGTCPGGP